MNGIINANRLINVGSWHQCQTKRGLRICPQPLRIVLIILLVISVMLLSACSKTTEGKITGAYQPLRSGRVQMYIEVQLADSTQVNVLLPEDQKIWDKASNSVRSGGYLRVEVKRKSQKKYWEFVRFLDD